MWRCICGTEESHASSEALSCRSTTGRYLEAGLSEQLAQYEQLVMQLIDQHLDKKTQLQVRGEHLKLLEDLKVKLRENEEALLEKTQLVDVLQKELHRNNRDLALLEDFNEKLGEIEEELRKTTQQLEILQTNLEWNNCAIVELVEHIRILEETNQDLDNKYYAADYDSYIEICGLKATHEIELAHLKEQVMFLMEEAERSEDRFLSKEATYLLIIEQMQEELDNVQEKEELKILPEETQQERREQDPSSCKNELAELRHVRPAPRKQKIGNETHKEHEEAFENDSIEKVVVARKKAKKRVRSFKRLFASRKVRHHDAW
ncbi:uncharacterized protein LOC129695142 [Leucoraja erinacea]|uniref:uncharacterized protein LOC129695142 n=1 Tax=Leucoraja erinaceus TaxID=7782 RepID=UPI002456B822|nr:uncharacterized protein LOC129695142 [Leucoraja erinacea]